MNKLASVSQASSDLISLDELDYAIIDLLRADGRLPYRAIARELGLTETTVRSRVKRLEESGTMRVVAVTDIEAAGYQMLLAIGVQVENRSPSDVAADLAKIPEIFSVNVVVGTHDVEVLVVAEDLDALNNLLSEVLSSISGIRRLTPSLAVNVLKNQPDWVPFHDQA
ncbi:MAG: Lrp/AsnC family transcriptional regulator [Proteobacteria bacterium]|nr:Lrp/AsnC family transcriptional regulator [Pseudomonadota bacterium]